jgi:glycosyl transferase family 87
MTIGRKNFAVPAATFAVILAVILGSLLAGALYSCWAGEDINWDWRNYHEYGAYALLNGRFDVDVVPGGFQSFLNPLPYLPPYLLRHWLGAPFWGPLLGAIHGLNLVLVFWLSRGLLGAAASAFALMAAVVIAAFGPMTLSEVGTSFADILTALPIIAGVGLILLDGERQRSRLIVAGLLIGAAAGLKLTNMTFLIGAGASLLLVARPIPAMLRFGAGCVAGVLATGGVWACKLWAEFGNPVFPFYNAIFRSPEAPLQSIADMRFMPHGLLDAAAYPFYWLVGDHRSSEWAFRDPRFAVLIVLMALTFAVGFWRKAALLRARDKQFLLLFWVSYALWLQMFSIHRYAVVLELLTAPLIVLLLCRLIEAFRPATSQAGSARIGGILTTTVALAIAVWSQPADWSRRPWSDPYQPQLASALMTPATYLMLEKPMGYVVPLLPAGSRVYQVSDIVMPIVPGGSLDHRIRAGLAQPLPGGVWALHLRGGSPRLDLLDAYDLKIDTARSCESIPGADGIDSEACPLVSRPNASSTAAVPPTEARTAAN